MISMISAAWRALQLCSHVLPLWGCHFIHVLPYDLGRPWLPLTHVLHVHLAAPSASSCFVRCWVTRMPWTVLRPSFRSCQVETMTCTSHCALSNSHLRAGCQCLRCWIPWQPQFSSAYAPDEFSCLTWTFHCQTHVRQQFALSIFLWWTYNRINLRCRFIQLLAWLPTPLGTVLDSLPKCAPCAHLTLLQTTPTKRTRRPR
jgi:hypothetical protein